MMASLSTHVSSAEEHAALVSPVNPGSPIPLYLQARSILIRAIEKGVFPAGSQLPSTGDISRQLRVSMLTAHRALQALAQEGWVARGQGHRTFVRRDFRSSVDRKHRHRMTVLVRRHELSHSRRARALLASAVAAASDLTPRVEFVVSSYTAFSTLDLSNTGGVLCICPARSDFFTLEEIARERPVVILGASSATTSLNCVDSNNLSDAPAATRRLAGRAMSCLQRLLELSTQRLDVELMADSLSIRRATRNERTSALVGTK